MVKVSIIIAAYNIEDYIERCLISCMNQTFKDIEIIVVNDGSTDSTLEIINKCTYDDSRVKIIDKKNAGLIEARKSGFNIAKGEYILFVDGDDWIHLDTINILYNNAKEKDYDIVCYKYLLKYEDGREKIEWNNIDNIKNDSLLDLLFDGKITHTIWSKFIKRKFIIDNEIEFPEDISYGEDLALVYTLAMYKPSFKVVNEYLYYYYKRNDSLDSGISEKVCEIVYALRFIENKLIKNNLYDIYKEAFDYKVYIHTYYLRKEYIFNNKNSLSKRLFNNWKQFRININTKNNKFYKLRFDQEGKNALIVDTICKKSYFLGHLCYALIK